MRPLKITGPATFGWMIICFLPVLFGCGGILHWGVLFYPKDLVMNWVMGILGGWFVASMTLQLPTSVVIDEVWITQWFWGILPRRLGRTAAVTGVESRGAQLWVLTESNKIWLGDYSDGVLLGETVTALRRRFGLEAEPVPSLPAPDSPEWARRPMPPRVTRRDEDRDIVLEVPADNHRMLGYVYGCAAWGMGFFTFMAAILCKVMSEDPTMDSALFWCLVLFAMFGLLLVTLQLFKLWKRPRYGKVRLRLDGERLEMRAPGGQLCQIALARLDRCEFVGGEAYLAIWSEGRFYQVGGMTEATALALLEALRIALAEVRGRRHLAQ